MPVPTDPHDFVAGTPAVADQIDERFKRIYDTLNPAEIGIDDENIAAAANINATKLLDGSIATAKLADDAVTAAKIETQQAWQDLAMAGNFAGQTLRYMKDSLGFVHVRPDAITAAIAGGQVIATFPVGYRPGVSSYFVLPYNTGNGVRVDLTVAGALSFSSPIASGVLSFGGVYFRAEN
jgi:hypothetical protein